MSLGPQGGRGLLVTMWRLALARQQLLLVAVAMVLLDASALLAVIGALWPRRYLRAISRARSTTRRARSRTLSAARSVAAARAPPPSCCTCVVRPWPLSWLRAAYIRGLAGKGGLPRPTWTSVMRLVLLDV